MIEELEETKPTPSVALTIIPRKNLVFEEKDKIGAGGYGEVYRASWQGITVAVKHLYLKHLAESLKKDFEHEASMMALCQFPHIVRLYGICLEPGEYAMVMEYVSKGSLYEVLHNLDEELPWNPLRWRIAIDMSRGLAYLHSQKVLHRDLKSLNILLDGKYHAKISDFGLSKVKVHSSTTTNNTAGGMGTMRWRAPELFKMRAVPNMASDVYSCGMVLWEIGSRQLPYSAAQDDTMAMGFIKDGEKEELPPDCPLEYGEIVLACWEQPLQRPTASVLQQRLGSAKPTPLPKKKPKRPHYHLDGNQSWHIDPETPGIDQINNQPYVLLKATDKDAQKVANYYMHHPVPRYDITQIEVIFNPVMNDKFALNLVELQNRDNNPAFVPKWQNEKSDKPEEKALREKIHQYFITLTQPHGDSNHSAVKLLPVWHGTSPVILDSILKTGFANLATTDSGYFGKGIYGAHEAEYAHRTYSKGALLINWVAIFSAFPVIYSDMHRLELGKGKANYGNYDAHFVPVATSQNYACKPGQKHRYTEVVVFQSAACLPRYRVTLEKQNLKGVPQKVANDGGKKDYQEGQRYLMNNQIALALEHFKVASEAGYPPADVVFGFLYKSGGCGFPKDPVKSELYYEKIRGYMNWFHVQAQEENNEDAQACLGFCYAKGIMVDINNQEAVKYYELAAKQGNARAQHDLAVCYAEGKGVGKDMAQAAQLYEMAANQGNLEALFNLGICYQKGEGVPKNLEKAITCFKTLADQGDPEAQFFLGACYKVGEGVKKDKNEAIKYFTLAAKQGHKGAENQLNALMGSSGTFFKGPKSSGQKTPEHEQKNPVCVLQ